MRVTFPLLAAGLMMASSFVPTTARAADVDILAGRSVTSGSRWTNSAFVNVAFNTYEYKNLHIRPVATVGWVDGRSTHHDNLDHDVYVAGGGLRLENFWHGMFASFQVGVAGGRTDALSSAGQFISSVGWSGHHMTFMIRHISNGHIFHGRNLGETMAMVGVRF